MVVTLLDGFVRKQVLSLSAQRAPMPRPAQCMIITRVAPGSVAAHAGLSPRDFLAQMDGADGASLRPELYLYRAPKHDYVFYARARHERVELMATGIDLGIEVKPTPDAVKATYDPKKPDYKALETLWEARDHASLESLASGTLKAAGRDTPALVFWGAAVYDSGRHDEAMRLIQEYHERYASNWTMNFAAVARYYLGLDSLEKGDRESGVRLLESAFDYNPFDRIASALEKYKGSRPVPPPSPWNGKRFPVDYELPLLESATPGTLSLSRTLAGMPPEKLLLVCLLVNYRTNGPYNTLMARYLAWAPHFAPFLHALHVITEVAERPADMAPYFRSEDSVREARLPFALLLDGDGTLGATVRPHGSPYVLALDRAATVQYAGEIESADLWELLGRVAG